MGLQDYYKADRVASLLGVHPESVRRMTRDGRIDFAISFYGTYLYPKVETNSFAETYRKFKWFPLIYRETLEAVQDRGSCTGADIAKQFSLSLEAANQRLRRLLSQGMLTRERKGRRRYWYTITEEGAKLL